MIELVQSFLIIEFFLSTSCNKFQSRIPVWRPKTFTFHGESECSRRYVFGTSQRQTGANFSGSLPTRSEIIDLRHLGDICMLKYKANRPLFPSYFLAYVFTYNVANGSSSLIVTHFRLASHLWFWNGQWVVTCLNEAHFPLLLILYP